MSNSAISTVFSSVFLIKDLEPTLKIAVICEEQVELLPPVLSLLSSLGRLGHDTTLITRDGSAIRRLGVDVNRIVEYGKLPAGGLARKGFPFHASSAIREELRRGQGEYDLIWTTTDISARAAGRELYNYRYVVQLMELVETVPLVWNRLPLHSNEVKEIARRAWKVVVPEYNRAYLQQVYWSLPKVPCVLPNKPAYQREDGEVGENPYQAKVDLVARDERKVILYQGVFGADRDLTPYARAVERMSDSFVLYLMGPSDDPASKQRIETLCKDFTCVNYLGYIEPPHHLAFARYAWGGLMPYAPTWNNRFSPFNALYCAPNKIWEYTRFGLPVIASDVPGIRQALEGGDFGRVVNASNVDSIVRAIEDVDERHDLMSKNSRAYYDSVDFDAIVADILEDQQ